MDRRTVIGGVAAALCSSTPALTQTCWPWVAPTTHALPVANVPLIDAQQTQVWCWAAATQAIFRAYGHQVSQSMIVSKAFNGMVIPSTATPDVMLAVLNAQYTDNAGVPFTASTPRYVDNFGVLPGGFKAFAMQPGLTNPEVYAELDAGRPVFFADRQHAMVLVALTERCGVPLSAVVLDPEPVGGVFRPGVPAIGPRLLAPNDMLGFLVAIADVH